MKEKKHYTAPVTQRATVELEGGFCGSIYETKAIKTKGHETGETYDFGGNEEPTGEDFSISWD